MHLFTCFVVPNETQWMFPYTFSCLLHLLFSGSVDWTLLFQCTAEVGGWAFFGSAKKFSHFHESGGHTDHDLSTLRKPVFVHR